MQENFFENFVVLGSALAIFNKLFGSDNVKIVETVRKAVVKYKVAFRFHQRHKSGKMTKYSVAKRITRFKVFFNES